LLSNAVKYSPPESDVNLSVIVEGDEAIVSVSDLGEGIPAAEQARVFDRFYRLENGLTKSTGGTGLGLYIARQLVEAMHGRLWVTSGPGGSTFSFSLPVAGEGQDGRGDGNGLLRAVPATVGGSTEPLGHRA